MRWVHVGQSNLSSHWQLSVTPPPYYSSTHTIATVDLLVHFQILELGPSGE